MRQSYDRHWPRYHQRPQASNAYGDVARLYGLMQGEAMFLEETIFRECRSKYQPRGPRLNG
ncbi:hypothetical protein ACTXT7_014991 [Hymenolepis weldensis]